MDGANLENGQSVTDGQSSDGQVSSEVVQDTSQVSQTSEEGTSFDPKDYISRREYNKAMENYRKKEKEFNGYKTQNQKAVEFYETLANSDPKVFSEVYRILTQGVGDPEKGKSKAPSYDEYEPLVKEKFSQFDETSTRVERQEKEINDLKNFIYQNNMKSLHGFYNQLVKDSGYLDNEGNYINSDLGDLLETSVMAEVNKISANPNFPTTEEVKEAFEKVKKSLYFVEKQSLKKRIEAPNVPPTASKTGIPPSPKGNERFLDRNERLKALSAFNPLA